MELVRGNLLQSFDFYKALVLPFAKAAYMMFVVGEVHPFLDGNGGLARIKMNAELYTAQQTKIIIPTVFREDYLGALRRLTRNNDPKVYVRMLERDHVFRDNPWASDMESMQALLRKCHALKERNEGVLKMVG